MSTDISYKTTEISYRNRGKLEFRMKPESLSEYISRIKSEKNLTLRQIAQNSGGKITAGYINDLIQGKTKNPSAQKIKALARGLRVLEDEVRAGKRPAGNF